MELLNLLIAITALCLSGFIFIRDYILPAKVEFFVGDSFQIVRGSRNKIQVNLNLTNSRNKLSVINHLEGSLKSPNGNSNRYVWNIFYKVEYINAAMTASPDRLPTSISVLAKDCVLQSIEFISDENFSWVEGVYEFKILGWSNRGLNTAYNIEKVIKFSLNKGDIDDLALEETYNGLAVSRSIKITN